MSTYATGKGELATITLPDGSTIVLNVASRLQVPTNYAAGNRTVYLAGEALFTVSHRRGAPFTVIAGPSTTRVLGTSFLVRHYATDTAATVAVRDGKVAVQSTVLTGAQQVSVGAHGIGLIRPATAMQFSFASGMLMIDDMTLPAAIPELNRWYNADIRLGDSTLTTRKVFGSFKSGSLTDLSAILDMMFNVRVVRDGHTLTLYPRQ
jgi:ferric-dicitrate binding protein FerR (iron transport regulator)